MKDSKDFNLCWFDIETTGLDEFNDDILEVAAVITPFHPDPYTDTWNPITAFHCVLPSINVSDPDLYERIHPAVVKMHTESGLFAEVHHSTHTIIGVETALRALCSEPGKKYMLAGNSVHFDRKFAKRYFPSFEGKLYHRHFDVSAAIEVFEACGIQDPIRWEDNKQPVAHRAMQDIVMSMEIARRLGKRMVK